ncbi:uncharacterized protein F4822DRAFT_131716 [Hypoxylon trugodes]|uniref:uncharacterized protein n=1 Tax=Hypoxylon trugodes TaxID=326681 RepID=UPI00218D092C|nr:uncharacterized protein F4822DRAFT_131716 [Hypoxylon trugodes]KAI1392526.1 hypothetical protein F4822DRAFT_131716 [Hypoxylon trugodes]
MVNVAFMVNCDERDYYPESFPTEDLRAKWESTQTFADFLRNVFQQQTGSKITLYADENKSLKAWKLSKRYGIKIRDTNNLLEHLLYNPRERSLLFFHQEDPPTTTSSRDSAIGAFNPFPDSQLRKQAIHLPSQEIPPRPEP